METTGVPNPRSQGVVLGTFKFGALIVAKNQGEGNGNLEGYLERLSCLRLELMGSRNN